MHMKAMPVSGVMQGTHRCSLLLLRESAILWESGITCLTSNHIVTHWEKCLEGKVHGLSVYEDMALYGRDSERDCHQGAVP